MRQRTQKIILNIFIPSKVRIQSLFLANHLPLPKFNRPCPKYSQESKAPERRI
jgi:hypothetical protein